MDLDEPIAALCVHKDDWVALPIHRKMRYLVRARRETAAMADRWVQAAVAAKGIPADSPLVGEEWLSGPWALLFMINRLIETLRDIACAGTPHLDPGAIHTRTGGQVVVEVFPRSIFDTLLVSGVRAEVWMEPGVRPETLAEHMATIYRQQPAGRVALVLGAGNIAAIPPLDMLYKLYAEDQVCLLKMNPVNEYLGPFFERIFAALIADGYLRIVYGGAEVGAALCRHGGIDTIHLTGSAATHDAIVFGDGETGAARKRRDEALLDKPISSELGNVSPTIVVPGPWTDADLRFQAAHIATQKLHNAGFNCVAAQVLVLPETWDRTDAVLGRLRTTLRALPPRRPYYPGAAERQRSCAAHPQAETLAHADGGTPAHVLVPGLDRAHGAENIFTGEVFGDVLGATLLPGHDAAAFLRHAVAFCNDVLQGSLGANLIIHPATARALGPALEEAIAALRYGCVGVNAWTGVGFLIAQASWGAYPGHSRADIGSGTGVVHNALLFERPQKSVIYAPFYPFPRGLLHGQRAVLPTPPWFVTHRQAHRVGRRLTRFEAAPGFRHLPGIIWDAMRG